MNQELPSVAGGMQTVNKTRTDDQYQTMDLGAAVRLYWKARLSLVVCTIGGAVLAAAASLLIHPAFDATVRLMPPAPKDTSLMSLMPTRNTGDLYLGLLGSRTVADDVIEHQHLADYFHATKPSELRRRLQAMVKMDTNKDQFVSVTVRAKEPETAMRIANEYPKALYRLNKSVASSEAEHRREYFEVPLEQERDRVTQAEESLKQAQQKTGIVLPQAQVQLGLAAIADLKQQITTRQAQLAALQAGSTDRNAQVVELKSQIGSLNGQLARLEAQTSGTGARDARLPELTLEVDRKTRDVRYHQTLFEIISKQYENARLDQSYSPPVELVDAAVMPDEKSWPPKKFFGLAGLVLGGIFGVLWIGLRAMRPIHRFREFVREEQPRGIDAAAS